MTTADVRDMLGLPTKPKPPKKQKQELKGRKPGERGLHQASEHILIGFQVVWNVKFSLYMAIVHHLYQSSQSQNTKNGRSVVIEFVHGQL